MRMIPYRGEDFPALIGLREQMNRLLDGFGGFGTGIFGDIAERATNGGRNWTPAMDVVETPETVVVKAELPGIDAKEIDISVTGDLLTLRGEKREESSEQSQEKGKSWYRRECVTGQFSRSLTLPVPIDANRIEAVSKAGILTITLPKSEVAKPKHIIVKAH